MKGFADVDEDAIHVENNDCADSESSSGYGLRRHDAAEETWATVAASGLRIFGLPAAASSAAGFGDLFETAFAAVDRARNRAKSSVCGRRESSDDHASPAVMGAAFGLSDAGG